MYGAKKWFLYPPHDMVMSNMQIRQFVQSDLLALANRTRLGLSPVKALSCVQTSGAFAFIPASPSLRLTCSVPLAQLLLVTASA